MVKIRDDKPQRTTAMISFVMVVLAALATFVGWRFFVGKRAVEPPRQRDITDLTVVWECPSGERFEAPGGYKPLPCSRDGEVADIVLPFTCPKHGQFECFVRYEQGPDGHGRLAQYRYPSGPWQDIGPGVRCPRCGEPATHRGAWTVQRPNKEGR
jgi:hypothetical protein